MYQQGSLGASGATCIPRSGVVYAAAQSALQPVGESLQVDDSINSLMDMVEFHVETVFALLRRLEPVTGEVMATATATDTVQKVPLAGRIDLQTDRVKNLTSAVQATIKALQI